MEKTLQHMIRLRKGIIKVNEPLAQDFFDSTGSLLLCKGYRVTTNEQLEALIERGLYIDSIAPNPVLKGSQKPRSSFEEWESKQTQLGELLLRPPLDGSFPEKILTLAEAIGKTTTRSSNAAIAAMMLTDYSAYPISHSLHVAILSNLLVRRLNWNEMDRMMVLCAALTMNIAMIRIQNELCNVKGQLNEDQKRSIEIHPKLGVSLLQRLGVRDEKWLQAVLEHHESPGGKGYPNRIDNPCQSALIIRTCDIFKAKISPRATRNPLSADEAAKILFINEGIDAKNPFPSLLIKEVGIYPIGCLVKLCNGETAIVLKQGQTAHTPLVQILKNTNDIAVVEQIQRDTSKTPFAIQKIVLKEDVLVQIHADKLWP